MNAIQILERVYFYMDTTRNARFQFLDYNKGVNDAILKFINDRFGDIDSKNPYSFEFSQQVRDDLYTLIKSSNPAVTNLSNINTRYSNIGVSRITYPTDYRYLLGWTTTINGISTYAKPTTYNDLGPLLEDSLAYPTNDYPYYLEDATGYKFYRSTTGTLSVTMEYLKSPQIYTCGIDSQLIGPGVTLTLGLDYIATEVSVSNLVTYQPGDLFNAGSTTLNSGQVILASNTQTTDLPTETHEIIAKMAAEIMSGNTADYARAQFTEKEVKDSQ